MPRIKKVKVVEPEPEVVEPEPEVVEPKVALLEEPIQKPKKVKVVDLEKKRLFQEKKQNRLNSLVEQRALELLEQKEKDEEPLVEEEVIIVKKNRKPKQKKVVYIEEDEEIDDYVYKQTKPNIPIKIQYW